MPITKRLQYVQLWNWAWIDTWIQASNTIKSQIKFEHVSTDGDTIFGTYQSDTNDYRMFCAYNKFYFDKPGGSWVGNRLIWWTLNYNTIYEVEVWTRYVKDLETWNNIVSWDTSTFEIDNIWLSKDTSWWTSDQSVDKWYYVKMWDWDNLIRDMIPVMRDNGETVEAGMYDQVTETFFGNAWNSWTIIAGPEIYKHISKVMCGDDQIYPKVEHWNYITWSDLKNNIRWDNVSLWWRYNDHTPSATVDTNLWVAYGNWSHTSTKVTFPDTERLNRFNNAKWFKITVNKVFLWSNSNYYWWGLWNKCFAMFEKNHESSSYRIDAEPDVLLNVPEEAWYYNIVCTVYANEWIYQGTESFEDELWQKYEYTFSAPICSELKDEFDNFFIWVATDQLSWNPFKMWDYKLYLLEN